MVKFAYLEGVCGACFSSFGSRVRLLRHLSFGAGGFPGGKRAEPAIVQHFITISTEICRCPQVCFVHTSLMAMRDSSNLNEFIGFGLLSDYLALRASVAAPSAFEKLWTPLLGRIRRIDFENALEA